MHRVRTGRFEWDEKSTSTPGSVSSLFPTKTVPPKAITVAHRVLLILDDDKARIEVNGPSWSGIHNKVVELEYRLVLNKETEKSLFDIRRAGGNAVGFVKHSSAHTQSQTLHNLPLFVHFRPFQLRYPNMSADRWRPSDVHGQVGGRPCVVIECLAAPKIINRLYVVAEQDCAVVRIEYLNDGHVELREDIAYERDGDNEWVPSGWSGSLYGAKTSRLREACNATMVSHRLNLRVRVDEFDLRFPVGTEVTETSRESQDTYVVLDGGKKKRLRHIDP
jgi:hypothetical protein